MNIKKYIPCGEYCVKINTSPIRIIVNCWLWCRGCVLQDTYLLYYNHDHDDGDNGNCFAKMMHDDRDHDGEADDDVFLRKAMERLIIVNRIDDAPVTSRQWIEPAISKKMVMMMMMGMVMMGMMTIMLVLMMMVNSRQWIEPAISKKMMMPGIFTNQTLIPLMLIALLL